MIDIQTMVSLYNIDRYAVKAKETSFNTGTLTRISQLNLITSSNRIFSDEKGISPNELDRRIGNAGMVRHG